MTYISRSTVTGARESTVTAGSPLTNVRPPLETIRDTIADALWAVVKAQDLPAICARFGLADGTTDEAFRSKRTYVRSRLRAHSGPALLSLAAEILTEYPAPALQDLVTELTTH